MLSTTETIHRYEDGPYELNDVLQFPLPYINDEDLVVTANGATLIKDTDYGVTAIKSEGLIIGATITLYRAIEEPVITVQRKTPLTQEQDYPENGPFESTDIERSLDKLTMLAQENSFENQRFIKINNAEIASYNNELPPASDKPQMIVITNEEIYLEDADPGAIRDAQARAEDAADSAKEEADKAEAAASSAANSADRAEAAMDRAEVATIPLGQEDGDVLSWNGERVAPEWKPLPIATEQKEGIVKPDGYSVNVQDGTLYANLDGSLQTATVTTPLVHDMSEYNTNIVDIDGFAALSPKVYTLCPTSYTYKVDKAGTQVCSFKFYGPPNWFSTDIQTNGKPPKLDKTVLAGTWYKPEIGDTIKCMEYFITGTETKYQHGFSCCMGNMDNEGHFTPILVFDNSTNWEEKNLYYIPPSRLPEFTYSPPAPSTTYDIYHYSFRLLSDKCTMLRVDQTTVPYFTFIQAIKPESDLWEDGSFQALGVSYLNSDGEETQAFFDDIGPQIFKQINFIVFETPVADNFDTPPINAMKFGEMGIYAAGGHPKWEPGKKTFSNTISLKYDDITLGVNEYDELYAKLPPVATTATAGIVKPDGETITIAADGTITAVGGGGGGGTTGGSDLYGIRGDYATHYGILDCPNGLIRYSTDNRTITTHTGIVLQCAGVAYKSTLASEIAYTIQSVTDVVLFYAEGELLEAGDVFYQEDEPQNGTSTYAAWYSPNVKKWQFKSNDTGNVWREAVATPIANIGITEGVITRVDYIGYRILDDDILAHKSDIPEGTFDSAISPLTVSNVVDVPGNYITYAEDFLFAGADVYNVLGSKSVSVSPANANKQVQIYGVSNNPDPVTEFRPIKEGGLLLAYYVPKYGDVINVARYYRTGDLTTPYTSAMPTLVFGQMTEDRLFTPKLSVSKSSTTVAVSVYTGTPLVSYYPSTNRFTYTYTTSTMASQYHTVPSGMYVDSFKFYDSGQAVLMMSYDGEEKYGFGLDVSLEELGINTMIIQLDPLNAAAPSNTTNMLKISETYIERDGEKIWQVGQVTKGSFLQLACDQKTITVENGKLVSKTPELGGLSLVKLTEAEYAALATKDASTMYVVTSEDGTMFELYLGTLALTMA